MNKNVDCTVIGYVNKCLSALFVILLLDHVKNFIFAAALINSLLNEINPPIAVFFRLATDNFVNKHCLQLEGKIVFTKNS